jgi:ribosome-binding ATPase YchF (GTP1/OBG family)
MEVRELELDLDAFEGPFDLLLTLLLKEELEPAEVDMAAIVVAFVARLAERDELDLEACGEFLVLIAALLELKARALFPDEEAELAELEPEEAAAFRDGHASALDEVVHRLFEALDLVSFFTAGDQETRAWTLRRGETALDAAESIHTDIARGFIRCEVIRWDDLVECGSRQEAQKRGLLRLEGKSYVVADGDVLHVRI